MKAIEDLASKRLPAPTSEACADDQAKLPAPVEGISIKLSGKAGVPPMFELVTTQPSICHEFAGYGV